MAAPTYRILGPDDRVALASLAEEIFRATYTVGSNPDNLEAFIRMAFGPDQQRTELEDPTIVTIGGEVDGELQGYAQLTLADEPPPQVDPRAVRLWRLYIRAAYHGRGMAQDLMGRVIELARRHGAPVLWLGVWAPNARAAAFYEKCGFRHVGTHELHFGGEVQHDRVMVLPLGTPGVAPAVGTR